MNVCTHTHTHTHTYIYIYIYIYNDLYIYIYNYPFIYISWISPNRKCYEAPFIPAFWRLIILNKKSNLNTDLSLELLDPLLPYEKFPFTKPSRFRKNRVELSRRLLKLLQGSRGSKKTYIWSQLTSESITEYYWDQLQSYLIQEQSFDKNNLNLYCLLREKIIGKYSTSFFFWYYWPNSIILYVCINKTISEKKII